MEKRFLIKKRIIYDIYDTKRRWFLSSHDTLEEAEKEIEEIEEINE